jgi:hypothetical protein
LTRENKERTWSPGVKDDSAMSEERRSEWQRRLDEECPHQVVLPRRQLIEEQEIMKFLDYCVGAFDMYVEDDYAVFVRYCFADAADAAEFRSRFERSSERLRLAG